MTSFFINTREALWVVFRLCGNKTASVSSKKVRGIDLTYLSTLSSEDRKRFQEKLRVFVGEQEIRVFNPYEEWNSELWNDTPTSWPDLDWGDLFNYLVFTSGPFTSESLKAYKSLDAHDYFVSRKVGCIYSRSVVDKIVILKAEVRPDQAESSPDSHLPWIICKNNGEIITAHCDCKSG